MKRRFRIELLLIALACFAPVIAAYLLYYYGDLDGLPQVRNEERMLIRPAVPLPPLPSEPLAGGRASWGPRWSLLYVRTADCDATCRDHLVRLGQVHAALGRDQDRVRRVYVGPDASEEAGADSTLGAVSLSDPAADALVEALASAGAEAGDAGRVYVVDPHGNLVLSYPPDAEQRGLLEDLERLLDVSRIG